MRSIFIDFGIDFGLENEAPQSDVFIFFQSGAVEAPRGVQEAFRRPQEGPKRAPRGSQEGPRRLPGGSTRALGTSLFEFFLDIFGFEVLHLSQAFWDLILEGLWPQSSFFGHIF